MDIQHEEITPPARGARPRPRRLVTLVVAALAVLAMAASSEDNTARRADEDGGSGDDSSSQPEVFAVGDLVELGDWQVRVHGVNDPYTEQDPVLQPQAGNRWVAVDAEVTNGSDQAQVVSSIACFGLQDGDNVEYQMTVTGGTVLPPDGEVPAGGSKRGTLVYEVPQAATGLELTFQCDLLSTGTATIGLG
jgi:uncharacterized protein DUF4352